MRTIREPRMLPVGAAAVLVLAVAAGLRGADKGEALRDGYESSRTVWRQEQTDAPVRMIAHDRSPLAAHEGKFSEHFAFDAGPGSTFFFSHSLPRIPIASSLQASLFVRSNRAGVQLFARVVLPADVDPETGEPSFVLVPGTIFDRVERWQKLELVHLPDSVERQARVIRASTRRPVSLEGAYLDRLVVNLYAGAGQTEVFLDELTVSPVPAEALAARSQPAAPEASLPRPGPPRPEPSGPPRVTLERNRLKKNGLDWFPKIVEAPGANVGRLRLTGCDVLADDAGADPKRFREALDHGFLLMPDLGAKSGGTALSPEQAKALATSFAYKDRVAFWNLGQHLGGARELEARNAELDRARETAAAFRNLAKGPSKLTTATVDGELRRYSLPPRNLDLIGIRPRVWASTDSPMDTYYYLNQRRALTALNNAGGFFWAWVPAMANPAVQRAVWGRDIPPAWGYPQVQPEQLRMYTYLALSAGYRGIAYRGDAELTREAGQPLLIEMALLNEEINLFESILANSNDPVPFYRARLPDPPNIPPLGGALGRKVQTYKELDPHPTVRAAAIGTLGLKGSLLLVTDLAVDAQYQPPQMAAQNLNVTVPAPEGAQAWEISPGDVKYLERERVPGGTRITIPEFGGTALVLVTTDWALKDRLEQAVRRNRPMAASRAIDQAQLQLTLAKEINGRLLADGHPLFDPTDKRTKLPPGSPPPNDEADLLSKAEENIKAAREALEREDYALAWGEARRSGRPIRILMHAHWLKAMAEMVKAVDPDDSVPDEPLSQASREAKRRKEEKKKKKKMPVLLSPVSSPPLLSLNTLPKQWAWTDWIKRGTFGENRIPSGSFDDGDELEAAGWAVEGYPQEGITSKVSLVPNNKAKTKQILKLTVEPTDKAGIDRLPPFLDVPVAAIRSPGVPVSAGQFVRITVYIQRSHLVPLGSGGIVIRDSIGGEPLQFRQSDPVPELSRVVIFRRVPEDGELSVLLGLAGYGTAFFDELKVEIVEDYPSSTNDRDLADPAPRPQPARRPEPASAALPPPSTPPAREGRTR